MLDAHREEASKYSESAYKNVAYSVHEGISQENSQFDDILLGCLGEGRRPYATWSHPAGYYDTGGAIEQEAWAELVSAVIASPERWDAWNKTFPKGTKIFLGMAKEAT